MDLNDTILAEAEEDVPIEQFIANNNARDKGLAVQPIEKKQDDQRLDGGRTAEGSGKQPEVRSNGSPEAAALPKAAKTRETPQQRIDKAVAKQREAERKAQEAWERTQALEAQLRASTPLADSRSEPVRSASTDTNDSEPTIEQFARSVDPYTDHLKAWNRWAARQEYREQDTKRRQTEEKQRATQVYQNRISRMSEKVSAYKANHPDYADKINASKALIDQHLLFSTDTLTGTPLGDLVLDSDNPPELVVYFAEHTQDLQRIATLHPLLQAKALGEIEGRLAAAKERPSTMPKAISSASPPIKAPVGSPVVSADDAADDDSDDAAAFIRRENARDRNKNRHLHRLR